MNDALDRFVTKNHFFVEDQPNACMICGGNHEAHHTQERNVLNDNFETIFEVASAKALSFKTIKVENTKKEVYELDTVKDSRECYICYVEVNDENI